MKTSYYQPYDRLVSLNHADSGVILSDGTVIRPEQPNAMERTDMTQVYMRIIPRVLLAFSLIMLVACGVDQSTDQNALTEILQAETEAGWRYNIPMPDHLLETLPELEVTNL